MPDHQEAVSIAKTKIESIFDLYENNRVGIAQLIGELWLTADKLSGTVFELSDRPTWAERVHQLLVANNRELEARREAEDKVAKLRAEVERLTAWNAEIAIGVEWLRMIAQAAKRLMLCEGAPPASTRDGWCTLCGATGTASDKCRLARSQPAPSPVQPDYSDEVSPEQIEGLNRVVPDSEFAEYKEVASPAQSDIETAVPDGKIPPPPSTALSGADCLLRERELRETLDAFADLKRKRDAQPAQSDIERARDIAELAPDECGACGGKYPNPECGHLQNANYLATAAPCRPMTEGFVEAIAAALTAARADERKRVAEQAAWVVASDLLFDGTAATRGRLQRKIRALPETTP